MHYLIVAKVKDYPDFNKFVFGLSRQTYILNDHDRDYGKWKDVTDEYCIYWRHSTMFAHYIAKVVMRRLEAEKEGKKFSLSKDDVAKLQADCTFEHGFLAEDEKIYAKVSGYFDYIRGIEKYGSEEEIETAKYKDVVAKFGKVDAFVLPDFECRFTKHRNVECPFQDDDEVRVLDGYTYCDW